MASTSGDLRGMGELIEEQYALIGHVRFGNPDIGITPHIPIKLLSRYFNPIPLIHMFLDKNIGIIYPSLICCILDVSNSIGGNIYGE